MNKNIVICVLAAVSFGIAPTVLDILLMQGLPKTSCVLFCNLFLLLVSAALCAFRGLSLRVAPKMVLRLCLMGILGMGATVFLLAGAFPLLSVGTATVVHFLYPTIVTIASILLFHKKFTVFSLAAILLSIGGMFMISLASGGTATNFAAGFLLAIGSAFTYSFYLVGNEYFRVGELPLWVALFYMAGASSLLFFIINCCTGGVVLPGSAAQWGMTLLYCTLIGLGYLLLNFGISKVGAVDASFATLFEPVTSVLCGVLFLHEKLTIYAVIGFLLIFCSVLSNFIMPGRKIRAKTSA